MNHRSKLRVSLLLATLAAAAPALAQTVQITTAPIVSGYYYVPADGRFYAVPATTEYYVTPVIEERTTIYADRGASRAWPTSTTTSGPGSEANHAVGAQDADTRYLAAPWDSNLI
jgi:hypothetical protein